MKWATALSLAAVCFLSAGSTAHADLITYNFSTIYPPIVFNHGFEVIRLTDASGTLPAHINTTPVTFGTNVLAFAFPPHFWAGQQIDPATHSTLNSYALINLTLTDKTASGATVQKTLYLGALSGSLSIQSNLDSHSSGFSESVSIHSNLDFHSFGPQTVTFGPTTYKINFVSDTIHPTSWFVSQGRLNFAISDPPSGPPSGAAPEPSSLVLAGLGVPVLGVFLRRRRI
jgi:hypothetical protein